MEWLAFIVILVSPKAVFRSTGKRNKREAEIVCQAFQQTEDEAAGGDLTKDRVTEIVNETLKRVGALTIERFTIKAWLEDWLASKEQLSAATRLAYEQAVRDFLQYLGPRGEARRLESVSEADIRGFVARLRSEGRAPTTINKLVRKFLSVPFEKARRRGLINFNPVIATDPEKGEATAREVFSPEQVVQLLAVADRDWAGAILLAYGCGGRLQDIANLRWSALDTQQGIVSFRERKTGRSARKFHNDIVDQIRSGLSDVDAFALRWVERAWEIALNLHIGFYNVECHEHPLSKETFSNAVLISKYFADRQLEVLTAMRAKTINDTRDRLEEILKRNNNKPVTLRDLKRRHALERQEVLNSVKGHSNFFGIAELRRPTGGTPSHVVFLKSNPPPNMQAGQI